MVSVYLLAAVIGGLLAFSWGGSAFALPAGIVALVMVLAFARFRSNPGSQNHPEAV